MATKKHKIDKVSNDDSKNDNENIIINKLEHHSNEIENLKSIVLGLAEQISNPQSTEDKKNIRVNPVNRKGFKKSLPMVMTPKRQLYLDRKERIANTGQ